MIAVAEARPRVKTKKAWLVKSLASDHLPLVADLEMR
jgi:endonuclease/exonuclease/phosphatase family metal-dependent hydrolase